SFGDRPHASFVANRDALTFTLSGLSKICGLPQMKLAWLVASGPHDQRREAMARLGVIADTFLSVSTPIQVAAQSFLGQRRSFQKQLMDRAGKNLAALDRQLARQKVCSRLAVEGGWYAVLRVPATRPDEELAIELLEELDVYVHPGHFYGFSADGYLVVSLITPTAEFAEGTSRVLSRLGSGCRPWRGLAKFEALDLAGRCLGQLTHELQPLRTLVRRQPRRKMLADALAQFCGRLQT